MGATNKQGDTAPSTGAESQQGAGPATGTQPGTGVEDSVQGEGATTKQGKDDSKENKSTNMGGVSTGNAPGGTGVEQSTEGRAQRTRISAQQLSCGRASASVDVLFSMAFRAFVAEPPMRVLLVALGLSRPQPRSS